LLDLDNHNGLRTVNQRYTLLSAGGMADWIPLN
jgi:hypothetical protein